jgi:phthalate 3,4-dioxygenase ferredoxin reductase subunit
VWSDQYDWKLQFVSIAESRSAYEVLGDVTGENPHGVIAYGDEDGRFVAALSLNHPRGLMNARRMLRAGLGFDEVVRTLRETVLKHRS